MTDPVDPLKPLRRTRQYHEFTKELVSDDDLLALARVARWSGSGNNSQPWRFLVVRDVDLLRRIAVIGRARLPLDELVRFDDQNVSAAD